MPFIEKQLPKMVSPGYPPEKTKELIKRFNCLTSSSLAVGMEAMANRPDRTDVLRNAQFPVLLVLGTEDQVISCEMTAKLADLSSQVRVATIGHAGHLSMIEQPAALLEILKPFLATQ